MVFKQSEGLRDREYSKFVAGQTGSISVVGVILYATQSGTTDAIPVLCNADGILLTSGA